MTRTILLAGTMLAGLASVAQADTLRLLTWGGYAPEDVVAKFEEETGHTVEVTKSNNEEMIAKLRATGGGGFDLAQPSQDRIMGPQMEFGIYKPLDLSQIDKEQFIGDLYDASVAATTVDGAAYGVAHIWGVSGFAVDRSVAGDIKTYADLCSADYAGKISMRTKRIALLGFAFAAGEDPFAAYSDPAKYEEIITAAADAMGECKANVKAYWSGADDLLAMMRSASCRFTASSSPLNGTGFI